MCTHYLFLASALFLASCDQPNEDKERAAFRGTWKVTYGSKDGKVYADGLRKNMKITFAGEKILLRVGDETWEATFALAPAAKSRQFKQITLTHGDRKTKPVRGIYQFDAKGTLSLCFGAPGADRPTKFNTAKGGKCEVLKLELEGS
jgi:uncharacterized protein (TIGR03067 family)